MNKQTTKTKTNPKLGALASNRKNGIRENDRERSGGISVLVVQVNGQSLELPKALAGKDKTLREALLTVFPGVANATFDRKTAGVVKVLLPAGAKGCAPEPTKKVKANGQIDSKPAMQKPQRDGNPFTKEELERIVLWRAIFAGMEKEEAKAQA